MQSVLTGCLPFIHYDCMLGSGVRLRRSRDKTGLDEKLLPRPGFSRNLEVDNLASFIYIRLCSVSPECCRKKQNNATFLLTNEPTLAYKHIDLSHYSRFTALMSKFAILPSSGSAVETNKFGLAYDLERNPL